MHIRMLTPRELVEFDAAWRAAEAHFNWQGNEPTAEALYALAKHTSPLRFLGAHPDCAGSIALDEGEERPHPRRLCNELGLASIVIFDEDLSWAIRCRHEDWDPVCFGQRIKERSD